VLCLVCPVLLLFWIRQGSSPLVLVAVSCGVCFNLTPPFLVDLVYHISIKRDRSDQYLTLFCFSSARVASLHKMTARAIHRKILSSFPRSNYLRFLRKTTGLIGAMPSCAYRIRSGLRLTMDAIVIKYLVRLTHIKLLVRFQGTLKRMINIIPCFAYRQNDLLRCTKWPQDFKNRKSLSSFHMSHSWCDFAETSMGDQNHA
jgi:hypothetical protein